MRVRKRLILSETRVGAFTGRSSGDETLYVETEQVVMDKSFFGRKLMYPLNENMNWEEVERYINWR